MILAEALLTLRSDNAAWAVARAEQLGCRVVGVVGVPEMGHVTLRVHVPTMRAAEAVAYAWLWEGVRVCDVWDRSLGVSLDG